MHSVVDRADAGRVDLARVLSERSSPEQQRNRVDGRGDERHVYPALLEETVAPHDSPTAASAQWSGRLVAGAAEFITARATRSVGGRVTPRGEKTNDGSSPE